MMSRPTVRRFGALGAFLTLSLLPINAWSQCLVPEDQLISGGVGRDGIPALTNPVFLTVEEAEWFMAPRIWILGVVMNGEARAYPLPILWYHEIINDVLGGVPIAVSYCPLTGSGLVYDPVIDDQHLNFGVSGLLFDNNLVMFDRTSQTLWSQMMVTGICGPYKAHEPALYPVVQTTWEAWKALHPDTTVVSSETGIPRDYSVYPYGSYAQIDSAEILYPHSFIDPRIPPKAPVHGIEHEGTARAYSLHLLARLGARVALNHKINGRPVLIVFDLDSVMVLSFDRRTRIKKKKRWRTKTLSFDLVEQEGFPFLLRGRQTGSEWNLRGEPVAGPLVGKVEDGGLQPIADAYTAYWFAWAAFNLDTELFEPDPEATRAAGN